MGRPPLTTARAAERLPTIRLPEGRVKKFRQAAFVYLQEAYLSEVAVVVMLQHGMFPDRWGPPVLWLVTVPLVGLTVFAALYWWQNVWVARVIWLVHGVRLRAFISSAFVVGGSGSEVPRLAPGFWMTGIVLVVLTMWMLARAGWDL